MRKIIFVILLGLMIASPCFAQGGEPEGIFSIEETQWTMLPIIMMILPFPFIITLPPLPSLYPEPDFELTSWGFYNGKVYQDNNLMESSFYLDMLVASIFMYKTERLETQAVVGPPVLFFGVLKPIGIGLITLGSNSDVLAMLIVVKADDKWTPSEVE